MSSIWTSSIELMLMGMGTVFVFLALLVSGMAIMSSIAQKVAPKPLIKPTPPKGVHSEDNIAIAAVAAAAYAASQQS